MRKPLLIHEQKHPHSFSFFHLFFTCFAVIVVYVCCLNFSLDESLVGSPTVEEQMVSTCVDLENTCMGLFVQGQSKWGAIVVDPPPRPNENSRESPPTVVEPSISSNNNPCCKFISGIEQCLKDCIRPSPRSPSVIPKRERSVGGNSAISMEMSQIYDAEYNSFPGAGFVPPICSNFGKIDEQMCYEGSILTIGDKIGSGGLGVVREVSLKGAYTPRFWNPEHEAVVKISCSKSDWSIKNIGRLFREAIMSVAVYQRFAKMEPSMKHHFAFAVDVYDAKNILMQPKAIDNLDSAFQRIKYKNNVGHTKFIAKQMFQILDRLHTVAGVVHLDVKLPNWLIDSDTSTTRLILTDWGCAVPLRQDGTVPVNEHMTGTIPYNAPEHLMLLNSLGSNSPKELPDVTAKSDIWQAGMALYKLYFDQYLLYPSIQDTADRAVEALVYLSYEYVRPSFPDSIPCDSQCRNFFNSILSRDPAQRPSAEMALLHPWLESGAIEPPNLPPPKTPRPVSPSAVQAQSDDSLSSDGSTGSLDSNSPLISYMLAVNHDRQPSNPIVPKLGISSTQDSDNRASPAVPKLNLKQSMANAASPQGIPGLSPENISPNLYAQEDGASSSSWEIANHPTQLGSPLIGRIQLPSMQGSSSASPRGERLVEKINLSFKQSATSETSPQASLVDAPLISKVHVN